MLSITYVSTSTTRPTNTDLYDLLKAARKNNQENGITGMLIYEDGCFMQTFEGEAEKVKALYENIKRDKRHSGIITLVQTEITERSFSDWSMAFKNIDKDTEGHSQFMEEDGDKEFWATQNPAKQILNAFRSRIPHA